MSELNMSHGKMVDFVSFLLSRFTLATKLRNFDFESHLITLIFIGPQPCNRENDKNLRF